MHILILSQHYPPEPVTRLRHLTQHLVESGHKVSVVTTFPSYPLGKVYRGYNLSLYAHHEQLGVPIRRVFAVPYRGMEKAKRMLSYGSFAMAALLLGLLPRRRPDALYVYHPPLTTGLSAALYNYVTGVPFVYDVQDLWPEAIVAAGLLQEGSATYRAMRTIEDFVYKRATSITVISKGMGCNLTGKGVPSSKISVISNWGDTEMYKPQDASGLRKELGWEDKTIIMLAGNLGLTHGLETVVEAAELLADDPDILLAFVGSGAARDQLMSLTQDKGLSNIMFMDQVPEEQAAELINAADAMLVHLKSEMGGDFSVPHRIFSYMLCAKPIIAAVSGSTADLIQSLKSGWICPPSDPQALAHLIKQVAGDKDGRIRRGTNGLAAAQGPYRGKHLLAQIEDVILSTQAKRRNNRRSGI